MYGRSQWGLLDPDEVANRILEPYTGLGEPHSSSMVPSATQVAMCRAQVAPAAGRTNPLEASDAEELEDTLLEMIGSQNWSTEDHDTLKSTNQRGQSLAHLCAQLGYHRLLLRLIELGLDITIQDANGWRARDFALLYKDKEALDILEGGWEEREEALVKENVEGPHPTSGETLDSLMNRMGEAFDLAKNTETAATLSAPDALEDSGKGVALIPVPMKIATPDSKK